MIFVESTYDDAFRKWKNQGISETDIELYLDNFKILKNRNILKGAEADISPWIKRNFSEFKQFVDLKNKNLEQKNIMKQTQSDAKKIFENNLVIIICPNTLEASQKYGANTKWCICGRTVEANKSWNETEEAFVEIYFILPKSGKNKISVVVFPNNSLDIRDELDKKIPDQQFNIILDKYQIPKTGLFVNNLNKWLNKQKYTKNNNGSIDINGDVYFPFGFNLKKIPFKFKKVSGSFLCCHQQLTSLEGSPEYVGRDFYCNDNQLTSLKGGPITVNGDYNCSFNNLVSLEGKPNHIGGQFSCYNNVKLIKKKKENRKNEV
jgi:hypothetical protein